MTIQSNIPHLSERREVAIRMRDGSTWAGVFIDSGYELNFGDDRIDAAHGLGDILRSEVLPRRSAKSLSRDFTTQTP
jgi:hypothetical protein